MALVIDASIAAAWALRGSVRTGRRRIGGYGPRTPAQVDGLAPSAGLPLANLEKAIARRASAGAGRARAIRGRRSGIDIFIPAVPGHRWIFHIRHKDAGQAATASALDAGLDVFGFRNNDKAVSAKPYVWLRLVARPKETIIPSWCPD
jgi:hypothetical protein